MLGRWSESGFGSAPMSEGTVIVRQPFWIYSCRCHFHCPHSLQALLTAHCSLLATHCSLLSFHCSLLSTHRSLFTALCSPLSVLAPLFYIFLSLSLSSSFPLPQPLTNRPVHLDGVYLVSIGTCGLDCLSTPSTSIKSDSSRP
jgi:hypothetical protein